jgi:hypothetical protein
VKHFVVIEVTINSHSDADERVMRMAMQQGVAPPAGPVVSQKIAKFASEGPVLPEATQDAVEALVAFCNSEGIAVLPGVGAVIPTFPRKREQ